MSDLFNILNCKCPKCKMGKVFLEKGNILLLKIPTMNTRCNTCNYKFEIETGFFFGAMYVGYALTCAQMIACLILFWSLFDLSSLIVCFIITISAFVFATFNYRLSRTIWIYLLYKDY